MDNQSVEMRKIVLIFSLFTIVSGCVSSGHQKQWIGSWVGTPSADLFRAWGMPKTQVQMGEDRRRVQYIKRYIFSSPFESRYVPDPFYRFCVTQFDLDEQNIVVEAEQRGLFCKS